MGLDLNAPDHTTLSRRNRDVLVPALSRDDDRPIHLIIDSSGLKIYGAGEWCSRKHRKANERGGWRKLHIGVDDDGCVVAEALTQNDFDTGSVPWPNHATTPRHGGGVSRMANRSPAMKVLPLLLLYVLTLASASEATWSIVGVDPRTREVGSAGASCTQFAAGIVALAPGHGVLVDQAVSNGPARRLGIEMMLDGASPAEIIAAMSAADVRDDFEWGQLGVVTLEHSEQPAAFTGGESSAWRGHQLAPGFSVQGNVLVSEAVVAAAHRAYVAADGLPLAERLLTALEAGAAEGGDARCGDQTARSAYLAHVSPSAPRLGA